MNTDYLRQIDMIGQRNVMFLIYLQREIELHDIIIKPTIFYNLFAFMPEKMHLLPLVKQIVKDRLRRHRGNCI